MTSKLCRILIGCCLALATIAIAPDRLFAQANTIVETGSISAFDEKFESGEYYDRFPIKGVKGQLIVIELRSDDFNPFVSIRGLTDEGEVDESVSWWHDALENKTDAARLEVVLPADGEYVVDVTSHGPGEAGEYELRIQTQTGGRVEIGRLEKGDTKLEDGEFVDRYDFEATEGEQFVIDLHSKDFDTYVYIRSDDEPSLELDNDDYQDDTNRSQITFTAGTTGTYEAYVTSYEANESGDYRLVINSLGVIDEQANAPNWHEGNLDEDDLTIDSGEFVDLYPIKINEGETVIIDLHSDEFDPYLILDAPDVESFHMTNDDFEESKTHSRIEVTAPETATYRIHVTTYEPGETGRYELTYSRQSARVEAGTLGAGDPQFDEGEYVDEYEFRAQEGEKWVIELNSDDFDTYLIVRDTANEEFTLVNDDYESSTSRSRIEMTAPRTGQYQVQVTTYEGGETGEYRLTFDRGAGGFRGAEGELTSEDETLTNGEHFDTYEFDGRPGQRVRIRLASDDFDTYLMLKDPSGEFQENDDYDGQRSMSQIDVVLTELGTYQIVVTSFEAGETGSYDVDISFGDVSDEPSADIERIAENETLDRELISGDLIQNSRYADVYAFQGREDQRVDIRMSSSEFDPYLVLISPSGLEFEYDDMEDNNSAHVDLQLPESGRYRLRATSYDANSSGDYQIAFRLDERGGSGAPRTTNVATDRRVLGVFVGISDYPEDDADLPYCDQDARLVYNVLRDSYAMADEDSILLENEDATADRIMQAIRQIGDRAGPDDLLVFFFSGHGGQHQTDSVGDRFDPNGVHETLVAYDQQLLDDDFADAVNASEAGTCLVVIDACFSGGFGKDVVSAPGRMGLFSSQEDVLSMVADKFRAGGYLSRFFVDAISDSRDEADAIIEKDDSVTAFELQRYIHLRYEEDVRTTKSPEVASEEGFINPERDLSFQRLHADWGGLVSPHQILFRWR